MASEASAIAKLHAESWRRTYRGLLSDSYLDGAVAAERAAVWAQRFREPAAGQYVAVAEIDGALAGFVCAYGAQDQEWGSRIDNLHVAHAHQHGGIGAALMAHIAAWSASIYPGLGLHLWVLEQNTQARRFYERLGGAIAGEGTWEPPDGSSVRDLRYAWRSAEALLANAVSTDLR